MNTLSICLIVRDEEEVLPRCLEGIKGFADEIIIVDTGSQDATLSIAKRYTQKVYTFKWCDDFSAARNYSFSLATSDFIMWLDADDVVTKECAGQISALMQNGGFDVAMLKYAAAFDDDGNPSFVYYRERIFRRSMGYMWQGAVHEAIEPRGKIIRSNACIYHKKMRSNAPMRNLSIYQKMLSEGKTLSPREKFYYGRELYFNNMLTECVAVLKEFVSGDGWVENKVEASRMLFRALTRLNRKEEGLKALVCGFLFSFPHAEDCCILADYFQAINDVRSAIYWYERALSSPESAEDGGFINVYFSGYYPAMMLCVLYDKEGDLQSAFRYNELAGSFRPNDKSYLFNRKYFQSKGVEGKKLYD